jgi:flavin reductase (DIM6/NTAB) family NADH-FMN oxidoreductase RutF/predicted enzyme related to lactoylglutathione lyase
MTMAGSSVRYIVDDVDSAIEFYTRHLGFHLDMHPAPPFAMLSRGALRLLLSAPVGQGGGAQPMPDGRRPEPGGWNRIQLEVGDLAGEVETLRKAGARFRNDIVTGIGGSQILLEDPAGNPIELFQPASRPGHGASEGTDSGGAIAALFGRLTVGVHVVGVAHGGQRDGFTAAWLMQVSFDPLLVALSVNPQNASYRLLSEGEGFAVSVLKQGQLDLARRFGTHSGREQDKLAGVRWHPGRTGAPMLEDALAWLECAPAGRMQSGDHELVLGRVLGGQILDPGARPLCYDDTGDMDGSSALFPARF